MGLINIYELFEATRCIVHFNTFIVIIICIIVINRKQNKLNLSSNNKVAHTIYKPKNALKYTYART